MRTRQRTSLVIVWVLIVGGLGALLWLAQHARSPLDDADPARQRPGFLDSTGRASSGPRVDGLSGPGRPAVVFFVRPGVLDRLCETLSARASLRARADMVVVSSGGARICGAVPVREDPGGEVAVAFDMPRPRDGGPPVGYAVLDGTGRVRYRTLDPTVAQNLAEVDTIVRATP